MPRHALSHSAITLFEGCPLRFKAERLDKIPVRKGPPLMIGGFFHEWAQRYVTHLRDTGQQTDMAAAPRLFEDAWAKRRTERALKEYADVPESLHGAIAPLVTKFTETHAFEPARILGVEDEVCLDEKWNRVDWFDKERAFFRAKMDLRYLRPAKDGATRLTICDFKTGYAAVSQSEVAEDPQLRRYAMVEGILSPDEPEVDVELDYVRLGITRRATITSEAAFGERKRVLAVSDRVEERIRKQDWPATPGAACGDCPLWHDACPARKEAAPFRAIQNEEEAAQAVGMMSMKEQELKILRGQVKAYTDTHGPVASGGMVYGPSSEVRHEYEDVAAFIEWARDHQLPLDMLMKPISKEDLSDALGKLLVGDDALEELAAIRTVKTNSVHRLRKLRADEA